MSILTDKNIQALCKTNPPLISNYINWENQLQPSGFDLTIDKVFENSSSGKIFAEIGINKPPVQREMICDNNNFFFLKKGHYVVLLNEVVCLPNNIVGFGHTRSTLVKYGGYIANGLWDAGFHGRSRIGLNIVNEKGLMIQKNAIIMQMSFHELTGESKGFKYNSLYEKELEKFNN